VAMTENTHMTQTQLAERWQVAESTLERWRSEGIAPVYMKILGRVRNRMSEKRTSRRHPFAEVRLSAQQYAAIGRHSKRPSGHSQSLNGSCEYLRVATERY
jgi:hypothetical protein